MLNSFLHTSNGLINDINESTRIVALHVLTYAGFGTRHDFSTGVRGVQEGHSLNYRDALCLVLSNIPVTIIFPVWFLLSPIAPKSWQNIGLGIKEFKKYMEEMFERERSSVQDSSNPLKKSLTSELIRASEDDKTGVDGQPSKGLSDAEIYGNMYIFNFAGHDTTANTMAYAIALMAIDPPIQEWVAEEVNRVFSQVDRNQYDKVFPRLKRVQALMFEVLRLYPSVIYLPKTTTNQPTVLPIPEKDGKQRDLVIPPDTYVLPNFMYCHTSPEFWGPDSLTFRPSRWITKSSANDLDSEALISPQPGTFTPWATGPRNCPGMKFAQVEFVSVISTLMSKSRVEAVLPQKLRDQLTAQGMDDADLRSYAKNRLQNLVEDSNVVITTQILKPQEVHLRWREA